MARDSLELAASARTQPAHERFVPPGCPSPPANLRASFGRVLATRATDTMATQRYDVRLPASAGGRFEPRFWHPVNAPVLGDDGAVQFILHRVDEASAKANRDAVAILDSIAEGFFTLDRQWRFDFVNGAAHRILGRERGSLEGRTLWAEYPGLDGTEFALSLRMERIEVTAIVQNAVETSEPLIQAAGHRLRVDLPQQPMWLEGDPVRLAQIVANLLNNATKYSENNGEITVRARAEDGSAVICVRDTGIGIEPEALPHMFAMFSRGHRDSGRTQGGLGIGLALSRRLAEMHGGTLEGHSDGLGKGSEFVIRLPLAIAEPSAVRQATPARDGGLASVPVLVVDDNHDAGDSLGELLAMLGAEVRVARGGREAMETFAAFQPRAVLLDIGMPDMNGYEVARAIRSRWPDQPAVLVALTGWGQEDDRRRAREAGFNHHLVKPADIDKLQDLLQSVAGQG